VARRAGVDRVLTLDMGGTSTDVALCDGAVPFTAAVEVGGHPVHRPSVDIVTVGAGGGSIVRVDEGGLLRVGPASAGARPGPAAYGQGGGLPTLTDAHVVLGRLPADLPLAGGVRLDRARAWSAMAPLAESLGCGVETVALGALAIGDAIMARALRRVSVERGVDPAGFVLVAFGGAGPLHACALADALALGRVLVPAYPGALSALGLVVAAPTATAARTVLRGGGAAAETARVFDEMTAQVRASLPRPDDACGIDRFADVRYQGQSWELTIPWPEDMPGAASEWPALVAGFHLAHARRFGYARAGAPVELVTLRVRATQAAAADLPPSPSWAPRAIEPQMVCVAEGDRRRVPCVDRGALRAAEPLLGPAVIVQPDATTYVAPGWLATLGPWGDLWLTRTVEDANPGMTNF
jgi:N-methylhydantoinase A